MWKKATKIVLIMFIVVGILLTIAITLYTAISTFLIGELYAVLIKNEELQGLIIVIVIIASTIVFIVGACYTFIGATGIGLTLEVAKDIEQIKTNTTPQAIKPESEYKQIYLDKYKNPYQ